MEVLESLPQGIVQLTVTSPPYYRHKDYGVEGQLGLEATLNDYVARIRSILRALLRVTAKTGTCFNYLPHCQRNRAAAHWH
jgi:DNA methylase